MGNPRTHYGNDTLPSLFLYITNSNISITLIIRCRPDVAQNESWCYWRYLGTGTQYQLLAGPLYILMFAVSAIPMGKGKWSVTACINDWQSDTCL
jgi:hypothetical protein